MKLRICAGLVLAGVTFAAPSYADDMNPWGVWGDGAHIKKSKSKAQTFSAAPGAPKLGGTAFDPFTGEPLDRKFAGLNPGKPRTPAKPVELAEGGPRPPIEGKAPEVVALNVDYGPGEVIIDTSGRMLYYMIEDKQAYAYPIAVGKEGFTWTGSETVSKIVDWPDWMPPEEMRERKPELPIRMTGGVNNPLGAKAIYLGNSLYRIHGTNDGNSIGTAASSGCFRMHNSHVVHLAALVGEGTPVHVLKSLPKGATEENI
jgi:lipoprotein-anchoring transpeptidase ErfK/SrfK